MMRRLHHSGDDRNVFSDDVIKAEASGMNGHISKPFDPDKLYAMIAASCHKKRG